MADAQRACAPLGKRLYGWRRFGGLIYLVPVLILGLLVQALVDWFVDGGFGIIAFMVILGFGTWVAVGRTKRLQQRAWQKRGVPNTSVVRYRVADDGLLFLSPLSETKLLWAGLNEIAPGGQAWLFIGQGNAHFLPKRIFNDPAAERAFLTECLQRMTEEARSRSVEARTFVGS